MLGRKAADTFRFSKDAHLTDSAREGWELILRTLPPDAMILLPSYIGISPREGSGIFDPVASLGVGHKFYELNNDLSINIESLERDLQSKNYSLVLIVHYFGFVAPNLKQVLDVCRYHGVTIVEDCAHLFSYRLPNLSDAGGYGDYAFYSLHKFFPLSIGGLVVQNNPKLSPLDYKTIKVSPALYTEVLRYDAAAIAEKRRENFELWDHAIQLIDGVTKMKTLGPNDIPHSYPLIIEHGIREHLYFWLVERQCPVIALYYRLIDALQKPEYRTMLAISRNILNLPVHQDVDRKDVHSMAKLLNDGIKLLSS